VQQPHWRMRNVVALDAKPPASVLIGVAAHRSRMNSARSEGGESNLSVTKGESCAVRRSVSRRQ
jgi:hypothetical protein